MERWDSYFMDVALRTAKLSRAKNLQVGAVAVRDRRIICVGFNGTPPGEDNTCEKDGKTLPNVIHAEDNLIRFARRNNIDLTGCVLYVTHSPCINCAEKIHRAKFSAVIFRKHYRKKAGLEFLDLVGVNCRQYKQGLLQCLRNAVTTFFKNIF